MARKNFSNAADDLSRPDWPTMRRGRLRNGIQVGVDNSMWLYMKTPMASMPNAVTEQDKLDAAEPLLNAVEAIADMTRVGPISQRRMNKGEYRDIHALSISVPRIYSPPQDRELSGFLHYCFPERQRDERLCLFGVRLRASGLGEQGGIRGATRLIVNATAEALAGRGAAPEEFQNDLERMKRLLTQAGLEEPNADDYRLADAWWSLGMLPDTPLLPHEDHIHVHMSSAAMHATQNLIAQGVDCYDWPKIRGHHTISLAGVSEFDFKHLKAVDSRAQWAISLFDQQAMAVSVRGKVEPVKVTRTELRRNRRRFNDDLNERYTSGKMSRAEEEETAESLAAMEEGYSTGGMATLTDTSIVVAFSGKNAQGNYDASDSYGIANLATLGGRQPGALLETMMCSGIRANPHLHDVPNQMIACAGLQSLAQVGDEDGAVLGFTERDGQEVRISPTAASSKDGLPMMGVLGATGSGKSLRLNTILPTPTGWTTMGEVAVGDQLLGRDGRPVTVVFKSAVDTDPELFRVTLNDGQTFDANADHQWVVQNWNDRHYVSHPNARRAAEKWNQITDICLELEMLSWQDDADELVTASKGLSLVREVAGDLTPWRDAVNFYRSLDFNEIPYQQVSRAAVGGRSGGRPVRVYRKADLLRGAALRLQQTRRGKKALERGERMMTTAEMFTEGIKDGRGLKFSISLPKPLDLPERSLPVEPYALGAWLGDGCRTDGRIASAARAAGCIDSETGLSDQEHMIANLATYEARPLPSNLDYVVATTGLAPRLAELGLIGNKHIPDEYMFASHEQRLALLQGLMDTDGTITPEGRCRIAFTDHDLARQVASLVRSFGIKAWTEQAHNFAPAREIDGTITRAQTEDMLAVCFHTTLPVARLPRKVRNLPEKIGTRSTRLFIEKIERIDPVPVQCLQVDAEDSAFLIGDFVPNLNTMVLLWLATQFAQIRNKANGRRRPNIIIDLKQTSDHTPVVRATGGRVISLDDLTSADGVFDPLRFAINPEFGVDMAANMLLNANPWGVMKADFETAIYKALKVGVDHGANCIGQALRLAQEHDPNTPTEMVDRVFNLAASNHFFRACFGIDGSATDGLRVSDGMTLIKLGKSSLSLPGEGSDPSKANLSQRVCAELVKMMVFGSAIALTGRGGVLHLDEAWMFLLGEAKGNVEQLGRLARSQSVLPILYTQRCTDLVKAELRGYISRGLILHLKDKAEAEAACELFDLEPTPQRIQRIRAPRTIGQSAAPNILSMQSLRHPETGQVIRGSIGIHVDLYGRAEPVEIVLPKPFLDLASTNPDDMAKRDAAIAAGTFQAFDFDPDATEDVEDWTLAPLGRLMADVDASVFAHRSLLAGRANDLPELQDDPTVDVESDNPWEALGLEAPPAPVQPELEETWDTSQPIEVFEDLPRDTTGDVESDFDDEDGWGSQASDPWSELESTR